MRTIAYMKAIDPHSWAKTFVDDLTVLGERVPFERALKSHLEQIDALRSQGLTWQSIAAILFRAGAAKENGRPYSGDHLRTSYARIRDALLTEAVRPTRPRTEGMATPSPAPGLSQVQQRVPLPIHRHPAEGGDKEVSDDEVAKALSRLQTTNR